MADNLFYISSTISLTLSSEVLTMHYYLNHIKTIFKTTHLNHINSHRYHFGRTKRVGFPSVTPSQRVTPQRPPYWPGSGLLCLLQTTSCIALSGQRGQRKGVFSPWESSEPFLGSLQLLCALQRLGRHRSNWQGLEDVIHHCHLFRYLNYSNCSGDTIWAVANWDSTFYKIEHSRLKWTHFTRITETK